jgi:hypothetical protein
MRRAAASGHTADTRTDALDIFFAVNSRHRPYESRSHDRIALNITADPCSHPSPIPIGRAVASR